jgi:hypothetical protein
MPIDSSKQVTILSSQANPRSHSGMARIGNGTDAPSVHFKRIENDVLFRQELNELQRVRSLANVVEGIRPVYLRGAVPEDHLLFTDNVTPAQTLFNHLWNLSGRLLTGVPGAEHFHSIGLRVGRWLRAYHDTTAMQSGEPTDLVEYVVRTAGGKLTAMEKVDASFLPASLRGAIRRYLDQAEARCHDWGPITGCQIHGDFDVANVLIDPAGGLVVVDFADSRRGLALEDVVRVWHGVAIMAQTSRFRKRRLTACANAILHGYGLSDGVLTSPLGRLLRCWNAVTFLLVTLQLRNRWSWRMSRLFDRLAKANRQWLEANLLTTQSA